MLLNGRLFGEGNVGYRPKAVIESSTIVISRQNGLQPDGASRDPFILSYARLLIAMFFWRGIERFQSGYWIRASFLEIAVLTVIV